MTSADVIELTKALIACPSITPRTAGVFDVIEAYLTPLGFVAHRVTFGEGESAVENLYLRYGTQQPNLCFAGHTDVVPPGDEAAWSTPPFEPQIRNGELYGRGAEDMKGAIAAFMVAVKNFLNSSSRGADGDVAIQQQLSGAGLLRSARNDGFSGSISFLITQDEEGVAIHGTKPMLAWLQARGEVLTHCIVGEPTNPDYLGEMVKVGRRGSVYFSLIARGKQGHVAYPERADNPIPRLLEALRLLLAEKLDGGSEFFPPTNLEITSVDVGNPTGNVIPATATAHLNVRFNDQHSGETVVAWVKERVAHVRDVDVVARVTGESFLGKDEKLTQVLVTAIEEVTGKTPVLSTTGGTSDARFIKDVCPVIEFGTTGRTAHMVDERVEVTTLQGLANVYLAVLKSYFKTSC